MIKTEIMDPDLAEIVWSKFNFPWCTGYSPSSYRKLLDLMIHKDKNDFRPQHLYHILLFYIEPILHYKNLGIKYMQLAESTGTLALRQYGIRKAKDLITRLFFELTWLKRVSATKVFAGLVFNHDLVTHNISTLSIQHTKVPKESIISTVTTLHDMVHSVYTAFGDSDTLYGGDKWDLSLTPTPPGFRTKEIALFLPYGQLL